MEFSYRWLSDYVDLPGVEETAARLTAAGFAVELVEPRGEDFVFDVDVTTNRVDAMNHFGLAREAAILFDTTLRRPSVEIAASAEPAEAAVSVSIEAPEHCGRYVAKVIRGVTVAPSPKWLCERLEAIGLRPINNLVDITNFVLWETGQPLHAFDLSKIEGARIVVRGAVDGERLITLDGVERKLEASMPVIADGGRAVALAGVMGGLETEVTETTVDVLLESAWFDPTAVRRMGKQLGLHTDASHRFERGADPEGCLAAADRAAALMAELAGGTVLDGAVDARADSPELCVPATLRLDARRLDAFAGAKIPARDTERFLNGIGCRVTSLEGGWEVVAPSWRRFDLLEPADLFEEVLRLWGFDRIEATLPPAVGPDAPEPGPHALRRRVRDYLAAAGAVEAINYAFHDLATDRAFPGLRGSGKAVELANPLSDLYRVLRRSLLPGLVASARFNQRRGATAIRLFEVGHTFWGEGDEVREADQLAIVLGGTLGTPWEGTRELDFFDLKGWVEGLGEALGVGLIARPTERAGLEPGTAADLSLASSPEVVLGFLGRWSEDEVYSLFVAELDLEALRRELEVRKVAVPSRFPGIAVDLTLTHDLELPWSELASAISAEKDELRIGFHLRDRYRGKGVPEGAVNTTIAFTYGAEDRSLTQEEVNQRHAALAALLEGRFGHRTEE